MTERRIGTVHDYEGLHGVLRARAHELGVSRETLDAVTGLQAGYSAKVLAQIPVKSLGRVSLGPMLQALGLALVVVVDEEAAARYAEKMEKRNNSQVRSIVRIKRPRWLFNTKKARKAAELRMAKTSKRRRVSSARKAARARWRAVRMRRRATRNSPSVTPRECRA